MLIAFGGRRRSGKDTSAEYLIKNYSFKKKSFALPLREAVSYAFKTPIEYLLNEDVKDLRFKEAAEINEAEINALAHWFINRGFQVDMQAMSKIMRKKQIWSIREMLQFIGTDVGRTLVDTDIWVKLFVQSISPLDNVVVTDCRFENERAIVKSLGGVLVRVNRPNLEQDSHVSDNSLGDDSEYHYVINNDKSIHELHNQVKEIYETSTRI
jgi:hypothetical protein